MKQIILASSSPRRKQLLEMVGLPFETISSNLEEKLHPNLKPEKQAAYISLRKASEISKTEKNAIIIAADTMVILDAEIIGKPKDKSHAKEMLIKLSGKKHSVVTGFTILDSKTKKIVTKSETAEVQMKKLTSKEIDWYIKSGEPLDKAGAYGIQGKGALFVKNVDGNFHAVVGLPIFELFEELKKFGVTVTENK